MTATDLSSVAPVVSSAPDPFRIAGQELTSRLLLGTGGATSLTTLDSAVPGRRYRHRVRSRVGHGTGL